MKYKQFDVVLYNKIHNDTFFEFAKKNNNLLIDFKKDNLGNFHSEYIKTRPAIIIKTMMNNKYLIVPLTSKESSNPLIQTKYRTHLIPLDYIDSKNIKHISYLQWDETIIVNKKQLNGWYRIKNNKNVWKLSNLSVTTRRFIKKEFYRKINNCLE